MSHHCDYIPDPSKIGLREIMPSLGNRKIAKSSKGHFIGWLTVGSGKDRRIVQFESHLEFCWCLCLVTQPGTHSLVEQVEFVWEFEAAYGEIKSAPHYFDFVVTQSDGRRIAYDVRPVAGYCGDLARDLPHIRVQAIAAGFVDEVFLLTDEDLDPVMLANADLLYSVRHPDPEADKSARALVTAMSTPTTLGALVADLGLGAMGRRAILRLIGSHHLRLVKHEPISNAALLYKAENP